MWTMNKKYPQWFAAGIGAVMLVAGLLAAHTAGAQAICPLNTMKPKKVTLLETFKQLPILSQGRIKPVETYAQSFLMQLSGKSRYEKESAVQWFARFLFAPRTTFNDKIFLINNPEILEALKVDPEKKRRYSYQQLEPSFGKLEELARVAHAMDEKSQSVVEKELVRVYSNFQVYARLSGAFGYGFQHPDFTITDPQAIELLQLPKDQGQYSFYDVVDKADLLQKAAEPLEKKAFKDWNETEKEFARLMNAIYFWTDRYGDCPLGIIPTLDHEDEQWFSPMDIIRTAFYEPVYHAEVKSLRDMTLGYWSGSQLEFDIAGRAFMDSIVKRLSSKEKKAVQRIPLELFYNKLNLFFWAKLFYGLAFMLFLYSLTTEKKWLYQSTLTLVLIGFVPHVSALILRILIMSRPPVSNLYETFIFVGLVSVILGIILELINKNWLGIVVASVCGVVALFIADKFSSDGDTMQMLVAVLNSNFWLSTHVLSITIGYAGCCVAGIMGHVYLLQAITKSQDKKRLEITYKNMMGILGFGLTMTFLGTNLGGIWADQSWGRFWGWDPKENGALLIILWCAIIFHCRISKLINPLGLAVGCVIGLIVVMWAWFGVNLLSVGLHSYGFTSGIANTLMLYVIAEVVFCVVAVTLLTKKGFKF